MPRRTINREQSRLRRHPYGLNRPVIFLDNDGTITNAQEHGIAYGYRYGELMAPRFGGTVEAWAEANAIGFVTMMEWYYAHAAEYEDASFFDLLYRIGFEAAFRHMGLKPPPWENEGRLINRRLLFECPAATCTLLPGAREAIQALTAAGYRLCLASNANSLHCEGVMHGCGLRQHFVCTFGPDLVDCATKSVEFYRRVCAYIGVHPAQAIVVDDDMGALAFAHEAGLMTVCVGQASLRERAIFEPKARITSLRDLPDIVPHLVTNKIR
ncbi:MAG: HAD family hydrolase [Candidatus Zipacnadales bacterium]